MSYKSWHSRGYLPHFDSAETVQFVTFRLADSLPKRLPKRLPTFPTTWPKLTIGSMAAGERAG